MEEAKATIAMEMIAILSAAPIAAKARVYTKKF